MRTGDWICTFTGRKFHLLDPHPEDVCIEDIAHGLSNVCRYGGHSRDFYSVAQHSVHVAEVLEELRPRDLVLVLHGLIHDAAEAYLGDMVRPLKLVMPAYRALENHLATVIARGLNLPCIEPEMLVEIKSADNVLLMTERRDLMNHNGHAWREHATPWDKVIDPLEPHLAKKMFLGYYGELFGKLERAGAR